VLKRLPETPRATPSRHDHHPHDHRWPPFPRRTGHVVEWGLIIMTELMNFEERARAVLPPHISAYYAAAAGSGVGLDEGAADWSAVRFQPRILREVGSISTATTILGTRVRTPVLIAPMAQQVGAHPDGEVAMGRAVAAAGSLLGVSTNTAVPFAAIARTGAVWWFQVYVTRDHALTERLVERAVENGARALLFTVDMLAQLPSSVNPRNWPESLKGVLRADDARRCVDARAAGVVVSTHGGARCGCHRHGSSSDLHRPARALGPRRCRPGGCAAGDQEPD
jgi:4-hydroxymandelate oxidase